MNRYEKALKKIKESEKCKPNLCCCSIVGPTGQQGEAVDVLNFADFYTLMPPDNAATVSPGTDVSFPQDGP